MFINVLTMEARTCMKSFSVAIMFCLILLCASMSYAATTGGPDCKACHAAMVEGKVHAAVMMGCSMCHTGVDATSIPHKFSGPAPKGLAAKGEELCFKCHDKNKFTKIKYKHAPVASGCNTCHNPHSSKFPRLLIQDNICSMCHDVGKYKGVGIANVVVHTPVAANMCSSCHNPHGSDNDKLLTKSVPDVCYDCHDKTKFIGPTVHAPVGIGICLSCHKPHFSDQKGLKVASGSELCFGCHDKADFTKKFKHKPVFEGKCSACHLPHAGQNDALLERKGNLLCRKCHPDVERKAHAVVGFEAAGHPVRGRTDPLRAGKTFGCLSCHVAHSSDYMRLFRYQADSMYDLCLHCHKM